MKFSDITVAWDYLTETTYFARPYYKDNGEIHSFDNEFQQRLSIIYVKVNPRTMKIDDDESLNTRPVVWLECGSFSLENKVFYWDYTLNTQGDTFEEAILKLADKIYERARDDYVMDYFVINEDSIEWKDLPNGHKQLLNTISESYWKADELIERIKRYENEANSRNS